jgi:signal transduction histidine kinase
MLHSWIKMQSRFLKYSVTALIIGLALVCQLLLYSVTPVSAPFMFFTFIVLLTTWFLGWRAGTFATFLSTLALEYFFINPVGFFLRSPVDYLVSVIFLAGTGFVVCLVETKRRADKKVAALNNQLEARVAERTQALEDAMKELTAKQALASVGLASASIAHEIGNPLHLLSLSLEIMEQDLQDLKTQDEILNETIRKELALMKAEVTRLLILLEELRDASRPARLNLSPTDMKQQVREVLLSLRTLLATRGVHLVDDVCDDLPSVMADPGKLKQVILNLCKNSVEAMPDGGTLTLRLKAHPETVSLEVHDTGKGIPKEADVFNAFATSKSEGWGLGLPIVYQIIAAHYGTVQYQSTQGDGTTFKICLPAATHAGSHAR